MKEITALVGALGMLLIAAGSPQAADYFTKGALRQARVGQREMPRAIASDIAASAPKFCYYLGGPKGTSWVCR
jgi:hypothetical protein